MRVRMLVGISGPDVCAAYGDEIEVEDGDGARLCGSGQAEPVVSGPETATVPPARNAALPRAKPRAGTRS